MVLANYNAERLVRSQAAVRRCDVVITCTTFDSYYCCSLLLSSSLSSLLLTTTTTDDDDDDDVLYLYIVQISGASVDSRKRQICVCRVMLLSTVERREILSTMKIVLSITSAVARVFIDVHAVLVGNTISILSAA